MTNQEFFNKLKENPRPVVVDFWAPWCGPCKAIEPMLKRLDQEYAGRVDVWRVNADDHQELLRQLRIFGIPTLIAFNQGGEVARQTGVGSFPSMVALFDAAQSGEAPAKRGVALGDRILRSVIGLSLLLLAYTGKFSGIYLFIALGGGVALFSAIYDRCPIWQAIAPKLKALLQREKDA